VKTTKLLLLAFCAASLVSPLAAQTPASSPAATPLASIPPDSPKYGVYPVGYRDIITRWLAERLTDPGSAKLEFGEPVAGEVTQKRVKASGYRVEFKVNSRNKFGMYTGFQKYQVLIRNGEIIWADRVKG
jgi:hypothetical protein